jgi:hypothetical protein
MQLAETFSYFQGLRIRLGQDDMAGRMSVAAAGRRRMRRSS